MEHPTSYVAWILVGIAAGFVANRLVDGIDPDPFWDLVIGIAGALVGGLLFQELDPSAARGLNPWSLLLAAMGSVCGLGLKNLVRWAWDRGRWGPGGMF